MAGESFEQRLLRIIEQRRKRGRPIRFRLLGSIRDPFTDQYVGISGGTLKLALEPTPTAAANVMQLLQEFFAVMTRADALTIRQHLAAIPACVTHGQPDTARVSHETLSPSAPPPASTRTTTPADEPF